MSTVEVNKIQQQCGTTLTVGGGACKTAVVDATTVTLGRCGGTVSLASGATQSGFGRTGTVDWVTTPQTGTVTAATGKGYFVNTTAGAITVNLPAGAAGSIVAVSDYASTAASNNITVTPNGAELINAVNDDYIIRTAGLAVTLVYVDGTRGWKSVTGSDADATGLVPTYITATGGTPCSGAIVCTNYKVHTFTGPGTFCVSAGAGPLALADYLVIAGGGGGGAPCGGGGGGAGGYRESPGTASGCYTASPLGTAPAVALTLSVQGYPITVGGGGAGGAPPAPASGCNGSDSVFSSITSAGGGGAGGGNAPAPAGGAQDGGSGGGGGGRGGQGSHPAGSGDTPATPVAQGFDGGPATPSPSPPAIDAGGGGGGALAIGSAGANCCGGAGGGGATSNITNTPTARAGGGGGGAESGSGGAAGPGGGAAGAAAGATAGSGTANTGGGGGGRGGGGSSGGCGGSGVVVIRYKFQ